MKNIAIFASGKGTNAQSIIEYFENHKTVNVGLVVTNNPSAGVLKIAQDKKVMSAIISKDFLQDETRMMKLLQAANIDLIVLAGFLQLVPEFLINRFPNRIINIHPALLPKFGGKGMYGIKVHEAVLAAKEAETGITIHFVDKEYDKGQIIVQQKITLNGVDNPRHLSEKVLGLEHEWLPKTIEHLLA